MDRLFAWYDASRDGEERRKRKKIVQIFGNIQSYPGVTLDRMPSIHFGDDTDHGTLAWFWKSPATCTVEVEMKEDPNGPYIGLISFDRDDIIVANEETGTKTRLRIEDVEAIIVL